MTWVSDTCTLPTEQVPLRVEEFNDLFAQALRSLRRLEAPRSSAVFLESGLSS